MNLLQKLYKKAKHKLTTNPGQETAQEFSEFLRSRKEYQTAIEANLPHATKAGEIGHNHSGLDYAVYIPYALNQVETSKRSSGPNSSPDTKDEPKIYEIKQDIRDSIQKISSEHQANYLIIIHEPKRESRYYLNELPPMARLTEPDSIRNPQTAISLHFSKRLRDLIRLLP